MPTHLATDVSFDHNGFEAGKKTAQNALAKLPSAAAPGLCLIFASSLHDLEAVMKGVRSVVPATQLIGGATESLPKEDGFSERALSVSLVASDEYRFQVKASPSLKSGVPEAVRRLRTEFDGFLSNAGISSFLMLLDGSTDGREATRVGIETFRSDVHLAGGEWYPFYKEARVIANGEVVSNAVSLCAVKGPRPFFSAALRNHKTIRGPLTAPIDERTFTGAAGRVLPLLTAA